MKNRLLHDKRFRKKMTVGGKSRWVVVEGKGNVCSDSSYNRNILNLIGHHNFQSYVSRDKIISTDNKKITNNMITKNNGTNNIVTSLNIHDPYNTLNHTSLPTVGEFGEFDKTDEKIGEKYNVKNENDWEKVDREDEDDSGIGKRTEIKQECTEKVNFSRKTNIFMKIMEKRKLMEGLKEPTSCKKKKDLLSKHVLMHSKAFSKASSFAGNGGDSSFQYTNQTLSTTSHQTPTLTPHQTSPSLYQIPPSISQHTPPFSLHLTPSISPILDLPLHTTTIKDEETNLQPINDTSPSHQFFSVKIEDYSAQLFDEVKEETNLEQCCFDNRSRNAEMVQRFHFEGSNNNDSTSSHSGHSNNNIGCFDYTNPYDNDDDDGDDDKDDYDISMNLANFTNHQTTHTSHNHTLHTSQAHITNNLLQKKEKMERENMETGDDYDWAEYADEDYWHEKTAALDLHLFNHLLCDEGCCGSR